VDGSKKITFSKMRTADVPAPTIPDSRKIVDEMIASERQPSKV